MIRIRTLMLVAIFLVFWPPYISANDDVLERWPEGGHIRVLDPRNLGPGEAEKMYDALLDRMVTGYLKSGLAEMDYRGWERLNTAPYISDQHGARFVNVYMNALSGDFFAASEDAPMPVGTIVVKDSISAVEYGKLFGMTGGDGSRAVDFCGECHLQVAERDHLFELPEEYLQPKARARHFLIEA